MCEVCKAELTEYHSYWDCKSEHSTCHTCMPNCISSGGMVTCPRQGCGEILTFVKPQQGASEGVYIFVDNSNMWIEAKKLAAKRLHLKSKEDPRLRIDSGEVTSVVAKNRKVVRATLYGSEPPPIDSVWRKIEEHGWKVFIKERSLITNKEKQVDQQLVVDITDLASDASIQKGTIIIVSGDADIIPAIECGKKKNWKFEIWMWTSGISKSLKVVQKKNPDIVQVVELDKYLNDITFTKYKFDMNRFEPHLKSQAAVITDVNFKSTDKWAKQLCEQLRWPFQFSRVKEDKSDPAPNQADIILVFANVKTEEGKNVEEHFDEIFMKLKESYEGKVKSYPEYEQKDPEQFELSTSNKYKTLPLVSDHSCETVNRDSCEGNKVFQVSSKGPALFKASSGFSRKEEFAVCGAASSSYDYETSASSRLPGSRTNNPSLVNFPSLKISGNKESSQDFKTVVHSARKKKYQKFSEPCSYRGWCWNGMKCMYSHTPEEKEFFQNKTKLKLCNRRSYCHKGSSCNYAHSLKELFCRWCSTCGHLEENCSKRKNT